jgi:acyl-CoA hydrolase
MKRDMQVFTLYHLVKSEDLNHHGTLYAGRSADWFVEAGFVAAAHLSRPDNIVCLKIHGMTFLRPVHRGDIVCFESRVALTGKTRIIVHIRMKVLDDPVVDGFITFIHVDSEGHSLPHNIEIEAKTDTDHEIQERAQALV